MCQEQVLVQTKTLYSRLLSQILVLLNDEAAHAEALTGQLKHGKGRDAHVRGSHQSKAIYGLVPEDCRSRNSP
jgi:hypothetical protein